jgi:hypothetical protein
MEAVMSQALRTMVLAFSQQILALILRPATTLWALALEAVMSEFLQSRLGRLAVANVSGRTILSFIMMWAVPICFTLFRGA